MKTRIAVLVVALSLGCVQQTLRAEYVLTGVAGPPQSGVVRIVMEGALMDASYEEVAVVSATGQGHDATLPAVLGALQGEAAQLGCNAVIHVRFEQGAQMAAATGVAVRTK
jgi:hypothetical protein